MKQDNYKSSNKAIAKEGRQGSKEKSVNKKVTRLVAASFVLSALLSAAVFLITLNTGVTMLVLIGCFALSGIAFLIYKWCDNYISEVIGALSDLLDTLISLEEKNIFSENEDTLLSKLQSRVVKLTRNLRKQSEMSIKEKENIKSLVSDISHQLKTPLANLKIYTELLKDETSTKLCRRECIEALEKTVDRLVFLSEGMIKISRLEGGIIQLNKSSDSLNETVLMAVKDILEKASQKKVEIQYIEEDHIEALHDRNWTREAIFNLLDNGVKYAETGGKIYLRIKKYGMFCAISVEDENGEIPEDEQAKIFTRFYRGKNSSDREGLGLGLYLAREIAIKQGGYMNLKTSGRGNIFEFFIAL